MKNTSSKPVVCVSKCLGFAACRWNGTSAPDDFVKKLRPLVDFITVCPEHEIGLGVPREPLIIESRRGSLRLIQTKTEEDITGKMTRFARKFLGSLGEIDGFILKSRSPSCGINDVKVYSGLKPASAKARATGFFAKEVIKKYPSAAIESEDRLSDAARRKRFLTKIFISAGSRDSKKGQAMAGRPAGI